MKLARARHPAIDIVSIDRYVRAAQDTESREERGVRRDHVLTPGSRNCP
jgi:hypothetical protein